jgi:ankyrin repeat protein
MSDEEKHKELCSLCYKLVIYEASFDDIQLWLDTYADNQDLLIRAVNFKDENNYTPLHYLLFAKPPSNLVDKLLQIAPNTIQVQNNSGLLPIHYATMFAASNDVIHMLFQAYPKAIRVRGRHGEIPLHTALRKNASSAVIYMLFNAYPQAAEVQDDGGALPLHVALRCKASYDVIKKLFEAYPKSVEVQENTNGFLPLHVALEHHASIDVINMLFKAYPQGAQVQNNSGNLPLHSALRSKASEHVVQILYQAYPQAAAVQQKDGWLPLHFALQYKASNDVINMLFKEYPKAAEEKNNIGYLPLHYALKCNASNDVISMLFNAHPQADCNFFCFLHGLPDDIRNVVVRNSVVQNAVQKALGQRLPTFTLLLDFYWILIVIACFGTAVSWYNDYLFGDPHEPYPMSCLPQYDHCTQTSDCLQYFKCIHPKLNILLWVVLAGGIYFFIREGLQALSLASIGYFKAWRKDPTNYIDLACIAIMLIWPILMLTQAVSRESGKATKEVFRSLSTLSAGFLFLLVFSFLKRALISFAVFVRGFVAVFKNLISFIVVLGIIITAFALMFYSMFVGSIECGQFCSFGHSWFEVYTMILGNYQPNDIFGIDPYNYNFSRAVIYNSSNPFINGSASFDPSYSLSNDSKQYLLYSL